MAAEIHFDPEPHRYHVGGVEYPGVTRVLEVLDEWEHVPPALLNERRDFGRVLHEAMALLVRGTLDWQSLMPELRESVECGQRFLRESGFQITASELKVAHPTLCYAGTLDILGRFKRRGRLRWHDLLDFKSGTVAPRSVGPQTAAYEHACPLTVGNRYCVLLNPALPNGYKVLPLQARSDWHVFLSCLNVWRFKHG